MALVFEVLHSGLYAEDEYFSANDNPHTIEKPSKNLVKLVSSAHAAGDVNVTEGLDLTHVESQEDGEEAYAKAQGDWHPPTVNSEGQVVPGYWDGGWAEGNLEQFELDRAVREMPIETEGPNQGSMGGEA